MSVLTLNSHSSPGGPAEERRVDKEKEDGNHTKGNPLEYDCQIFDRGFGSFFQSGVSDSS